VPVAADHDVTRDAVAAEEVAIERPGVARGGDIAVHPVELDAPPEVALAHVLDPVAVLDDEPAGAVARSPRPVRRRRRV
jgi:hypothetical protein